MVKYNSRMKDAFDCITIDNQIMYAKRKQLSKTVWNELCKRPNTRILQVDNEQKKIAIKTDINSLKKAYDVLDVRNVNYTITLTIADKTVCVKELYTDVEMSLAKANNEEYVLVTVEDSGKFMLKYSEGSFTIVKMLQYRPTEFDVLIRVNDIVADYFKRKASIQNFKLLDKYDELLEILHVMCTDVTVTTTKSCKPLGLYCLVGEEYDDYGNYSLLYKCNNYTLRWKEEGDLSEYVRVSNKGNINVGERIVNERPSSWGCKHNCIRF